MSHPLILAPDFAGLAVRLVEPYLRKFSPMTRPEPEPGLAIAAGPRDPATKERAVPDEPSVVIARGVVAFDEWGHSMGARVHDMRAKADTVPASDERSPVASSSRRQSVLLLCAATFFLASAGLLTRVLQSSDTEKPALSGASAVAMVEVKADKPDAPSHGSSKGLGAPGAAQVTLHEPEPRGVPTPPAFPETVTPTAPPPEPVSVAAERLSTERPSAPAKRRAPLKAKRDIIIRDAPF